METLLEKARKKEYAFGLYLSDANPMMTEIAVHAGFDYLRMDTEHSMMDASVLKNMIQTADAFGVPSLVRIANLSQITQLLDFGVAGILVPDVETREQAQTLVDLAKFAPIGKRGF